MLLVSTTDPLPAHRPWSGGSTSENSLVVCSALSTAFSPLTPTAPAAELLIVSQPSASGSHLTVGMVGVWNGAAWARIRLSRIRLCLT